MTYLQLRLQIYHDELKQMLASIRQLFVFFSLLINVGLPGVILSALISLSVIENNQTAVDSRVIYQWGYFIFLFFLVRVQKKAIIGDAWRLYLSSMPITNLQKRFSNIMLTALAGNLPLLVPIFLVITNLNSSLLTAHLPFSLFTIATLLSVWLALTCRHFPWLSLLLFPLVVSFYFANLTEPLPEKLSSITLNYVWLIMFLIDGFYNPITVLKKFNFPMKYYWQIKWLDIRQHPSPALSRVLLCALFIVLVDYTQTQLATIAIPELQIVSCYILSLAIGSFQFNNEKFYCKYHLYLASVILNAKARYLFDVIPAILLSLIIAHTLNVYLYFSALSYIWLPLGTAITLISVTKFKKNFFLVPSISFILIVMIS